MKARCKGCRTPSLARPPLVRISAPLQVSASVRQESFSSPSMMTEHEPQVPWLQPPLGEVSPSLSRSTLISVAPLSTNSAFSSPFTVNWSGTFAIFPPFDGYSSDIFRALLLQQAAEMHRKHLCPIPGAGDRVGDRLDAFPDGGHRQR